MDVGKRIGKLTWYKLLHIVSYVQEFFFLQTRSTAPRHCVFELIAHSTFWRVLYSTGSEGIYHISISIGSLNDTRLATLRLLDTIIKYLLQQFQNLIGNGILDTSNTHMHDRSHDTSAFKVIWTWAK